MFEITVNDHFSAAHFLKGYNGPCAEMHGHNYGVQVTIQCGETNDIGLALDFRDLKAHLKAVLKQLDHTTLNQHPKFQTAKENPSAENLARFIYCELRNLLSSSNARIAKVTVSESESSSVTYWEA